jgi:Zn-dependent peptidase ImmA (M78 family)
LLNLFNLTEGDLISLINAGLKKPITKDEIFSKEINLNHLKRIDKIFNKGLYYYLDPKSPEISKDASIFFRKSSFDVDLNIGAKKIVAQFEEFKISLSAIAKLAEMSLDRVMPVFSLNDNVRYVANQLREFLYPSFNSDQKEFLKSTIGKLAEKNIFVFEFVENWNKKEKANIDGCFLNPNVIVLKRQQSSFAFRREIFTLIHELGHYLINEEDILHLDYNNLANKYISNIEKWCNDFAYYFLIGDYDKQMSEIITAEEKNDYYFDLIENISKNTHLSKIALFTRLLYQNKISQEDYDKVSEYMLEKYEKRIEEEKKTKELEKLQGIKQFGSTPQPIKSPLLVSTIQTAFYEGVINEYDVCKSLNIKPEKLDMYLYESSN